MPQTMTKKQTKFRDVTQRINAGKTCDNCVMLHEEGNVLVCNLVKLVMFFHHEAARRKVCDEWEGKRGRKGRRASQPSS